METTQDPVALNKSIDRMPKNVSNGSVAALSPADDSSFLTSAYNPLISRRLMEGICGISTNTLVKYESEGIVTPRKVRQGNREVVTYRAQDVRSVLNKKGVSFKKKDEAEVIAIWSQKGGVGKSAFCQHLSSTLSLLGRVLVVDLDSQGDVSTLLDMRPPALDVLTDENQLDPSIANLMDWTLENPDEDAGYEKMTLDQVRRKVSPSLDIVPADLDLGEINFSLNRLNLSQTRTFPDGTAKVPPEVYMVKDVIDPLKTQYDWIIFDCPPNIETLVVGALMAANRIVIPVEIEAKCILTIKRNEEFLRRLLSFNSSLPVPFQWDRVLIVPNKYKIEVVKTKALWALQELYRDSTDLVLSETVVPASSIIDRCSEQRIPMFVAATRQDKDAKSAHKSAREFTNYFWAIVHEILDVELDHLVFTQPQTQDV